MDVVMLWRVESEGSGMEWPLTKAIPQEGKEWMW